MFTRYHGNFLFSPSRNYPRFILSTPTPPLPSARVFRDPGIVRRFRPGLHAARERFDWRMANAGRNCFRQNHLNDIFPFLTLLYRALSFLHTFSFSSACLRSNIFFFSFFLPSSSLVPEIFNRVHDSWNTGELVAVRSRTREFCKGNVKVTSNNLYLLSKYWISN